MSQEYTRQLSIIGNIPHLGPILYFNDFSGNLILSSTGTGSETMKRDISTFLSPPASLSLGTQPSTPLTDDQAAVSAKIRILPTKQIFFHTIWIHDNGNNSGLWEFHIQLDDNTNLHQAAVRFILASNKWVYLNVNNTWTDIPSGAQAISSSTWRHLSLGVDFNLNRYLFLESANLKLDMSNISYRLTSSSGQLDSFWRCKMTLTQDGERSYLNLDQVLITSIRL